ncbi:hypothetical protein [Franconibacter daqui]|uniref:UvrD-like helicase ATP-binding domain-containing protein n=1 Tax=Franconibacter daqui TaxID=2047724 RepID=A0ABV1PLE8_9ENTR
MAEELIFAFAGSGKTTLLVDKLTINSRTLILMNTVNNETHLRSRIISLFAFMHEEIRVMTWFGFLQGFCFRSILQKHFTSHGLGFPQPTVRMLRINPLNYQYHSGSI